MCRAILLRFHPIQERLVWSPARAPWRDHFAELVDQTRKGRNATARQRALPHGSNRTLVYTRVSAYIRRLSTFEWRAINRIHEIQFVIESVDNICRFIHLGQTVRLSTAVCIRHRQHSHRPLGRCSIQVPWVFRRCDLECKK